MRLGADTTQLLDLAEQVHRHGDRLDAIDRELATAARHLTWTGADRRRFDDELATVGSQLHRAAVTFRRTATELRAQAAQQERASSGIVVPGALGARIDALPDTSVLAYDPAGDGTIVVAIGNIARARHVAVLVPGAGASLDTFRRELARAETVREAAVGRDRHRADDVAVIAWLGYDAPRPLGELSHLGEALHDDRARRGARDLRTFVADLDRRTDGAITLVGHSYGSLVVAAAARSNPSVDRVLLLGSPGVGVDRAADLRLDPRTELFAAATVGDPVSHSQWFGTDPTRPRFGAHVVATGPAPGEPLPDPTRAHSAYFDEGSVSLDGIAAVVTGGTPRPEHPLPLEAGLDGMVPVALRPLGSALDAIEDEVRRTVHEVAEVFAP
ncbi:MAG: alpha/beta hydrolase [Acidimicrobiales bacterium]